ncbi:MAG TPA: TonB-dependent receptor plug domain-containing protein, partial [Hanamia sp.]
MKLSTVLLLFFTFQVNASGYAQKITIVKKNVNLAEVFKSIENQTGYLFFYDKTLIQKTEPISITLKDVTLHEALEACLKNQRLTYSIVRTTVVIRPEKAVANQLHAMGIAMNPVPPPIEIRGRVVDKDGNPLQKVSISIVGTKSGTTSDNDGRFTITASGNGVFELEVSSIGFQKKRVKVSNQTEIIITLEQEVSGLTDVVVVGYGSQRKRDITGSIVSVDVEELNKVASPNLAQQLQGRSSGVTVTSDNTPGGEPTIRIRGFGTINNNDPLYVIDGVPTKGGLNNINPNNIESIQILKDASAASIYGSRASNGVIIITTIKGKAGQSRLTFDGRYGVQVPKNNGHADVILDPLKFGELKWMQLRNAHQLTNGNPVDPQYGNGVNPVVPDYILAGNRYGIFEGDPATNPDFYNFSETNMYQITRANKAGTNWLKEILTPAAPTMEFNLGSSGGSDKGRYAFGINYFNKDGSVHHTSFKRYSVRANSEFLIKNKVRVGENLEVGQSENLGFFSTPNANNDDGNPVGNSYRMPSIVPVHDIMGNYAGTRANGLSSAQNPVGQLDRAKNNSSKNIKVFGNLYAEVDIMKNLTARTSLGFDYQSNDLTTYDLLNLEAAAPIGF